LIYKNITFAINLGFGYLPAGLNWHILSGITGTIKPESVEQIEPCYPMGNDKRIKNYKFFEKHQRNCTCLLNLPAEGGQAGIPLSRGLILLVMFLFILVCLIFLLGLVWQV